MVTITELQAGQARVRVAPALGGRITTAALEDTDGVPRSILHPYPEAVVNLLPWAKGGFFPLIPYSGRIRNARLLHEGSWVTLEAHPGGEPHTLHGIAQQRPWTLVGATLQTAVMRYHHTADAHWPWNFEAEVRVSLEPARLGIVLKLRNDDERTMPAGIGAHPYISYAAGDTLSYESGPAWPFDSDFLAGTPPEGSRQLRTVTDSCLEAGDVTLFHAEWSGELQLHRRSGRNLRFRAEPILNHLVIHRPKGAPYVCIEPVSHVADGFNLHALGVVGTGTHVLASGEILCGGFDISID